jgi:tRNA (mo5U34)-methyltransferase
MKASRDVQQIRDLLASVPAWHHIMEFPFGLRSPGAYDPTDLLQRLGLGRLDGLRVLDIGARDGFFSFACERLGAEVVAVDHSAPELTGFPVARQIYGSHVEYVQANVYDLTPEQLGGTFDVVLFLGVLYHLRHPLLALDRVRQLCRGQLWLETLVCDSGLFTGYETRERNGTLAANLRDLPFAQFLPVARFHSDPTNKWVPNTACVRALLEDALFEPEHVEAWGDRALVRARAIENSPVRRWMVLDSGMRGRGS